MADRKSGGGSKLSRTQTVTVRLDPKLKYLADLAARKQRRTISSFIEWAIEKALSEISFGDGTGDSEANLNNAAADANELWDVDEAERFVRLGVLYPNLLTHEEQILWKVISDSGLLKHGKFKRSDTGNWDHGKLKHYVYPEVRTHWSSLKSIANGEMDISVLPSWWKTNLILKTIPSPTNNPKLLGNNDKDE